MAVMLAVSLTTVSADAAVEGDSAPDWSLRSINNTYVSFPRVADGKPAIILFWATWCPYCRALMPQLEQIRNEYEARGVKVLAINIKEDGDAAAFAAEHDFDFVYLLNGDAIAERYFVRFTPGLFIVDGNGKVVFRRKPTEMPPGSKVAEYWAGRVRTELEALFDDDG